MVLGTQAVQVTRVKAMTHLVVRGDPWYEKRDHT